MRGRPRLAAIASHPVQYQAPWYRELARVTDLTVFFAHRPTAAEQGAAGFGVPFDWDVPLVDGYSHEWLPNVAARPSVEDFRGCDTPAIRSIVSSRSFDAVLVNGWQLLSYWQAARAARRAGIPVLVRGDSQLATGRTSVVRAAKRLVYPRLLSAFDAFLAVGRRSREYYLHYGVPADRIFSAPHCVDNAFFAAAAAAARCGDPRAPFDLTADQVVFLFAGKLTPKKRPLDFMKALDRAHTGDPHIAGLIVGDGVLRSALDAHQREHGTPCRLIGFKNQREMAGVYAAADVLVLTSDAGETWGLVVNEAMACGLPAIVTTAAGCAADLIVEANTGLTYTCGDVDRLATLMRRVAGDQALCRTLASGATRHIEAFSPAAAAAGVVAALEAVGVAAPVNVR